MIWYKSYKKSHKDLIAVALTNAANILLRFNCFWTPPSCRPTCCSLVERGDLKLMRMGAQSLEPHQSRESLDTHPAQAGAPFHGEDGAHRRPHGHRYTPGLPLRESPPQR